MYFGLQVRNERCFFSVFYTVYRIAEKKYCTSRYVGSYGTLEEATAACTADDICSFIHESSCDKGGPFTLCYKSSKLETSSLSSCVYIKELKEGRRTLHN